MPSDAGSLLHLQGSVGNHALARAFSHVPGPVLQRDTAGGRPAYAPDLEDEAEELAGLPGKVAELKELPGRLIDAADAVKRASSMRDIPDVSSNLVGAAASLVNAAKVFDDLTGKLESLPLDEAEEILGKAGTVFDALDLLVSLTDDEALENFLADPTPEHAHAWAENTVETFEKVGNLVPDDIPFVGPMLKGYLSAPAAYLKAFEKILWKRIMKIDEAAGIEEGVTASVTGAAKGDWKGPLSHVYFVAPEDLKEFMQRWKPALTAAKSQDAGIAKLMNLVGILAPEERKYAWLEYLRRRLETPL